MRAYKLLLISPLVFTQIQSRSAWADTYRSFGTQPAQNPIGSQPQSQPQPQPQPLPQPQTKPAQPTPKPAPKPTPEPPAKKCQPWQQEDHYGNCICEESKCGGWKASHTCSAESQSGICHCSSMQCTFLSDTTPVCNQQTLQGQCVECTEATQHLDCGDHQGCYKNQCVCLDTMCEDDGVCLRQYSKNKTCVQCRIDDHCKQSYQQCRDDGFCVCKDRLITNGQFCSSQDQNGVPVECREDKNCGQGKICNDDFQCQCRTEMCPTYTQCNQQTIDGECIIPNGCTRDSDCPEGTLCQEDVFQYTNADGDIFSFNSCICDPTECAALSTDDYAYQCYNGANAILGVTIPDQHCGPPCTINLPPGDLTPGFEQGVRDDCPEGRVCIRILNEGFNPFCVPLDIPCRSTNNVINPNACPDSMYCLPESGSAEFESQPFCSVDCSILNDYCNQYPCAQGYSINELGTGLHTCTAFFEEQQQLDIQEFHLQCGCFKQI